MHVVNSHLRSVSGLKAQNELFYQIGLQNGGSGLFVVPVSFEAANSSLEHNQRCIEVI